MYTSKLKINVINERLKESLLIAGSLRPSGNQFHIAGPATEKARQS